MRFSSIVLISLVMIGCKTTEQHVQTDEPDRLSYYVPGKGTENIWYGIPALQPKLNSYAQALGDIIVLTGMGMSVSRISSAGELMWQVDLRDGQDSAAIPRISKLDGQDLYFNYMGKMLRMDIRDGSYVVHLEHGMIDMVEGEFQLESTEQARLIVPEGWTFEGDTYVYPRSAARIGDRIAVGDCFGHRTLVYDSGVKIATIEGYYPVHVQWLDSDTLLIDEEHANKVYKYSVSTGTKTPIANCTKHEVYTDLWATVAQFQSTESSGVLTIEGTVPSATCATEHAGVNTLFSPGGARPSLNGFIISDSDNHRVVEVDSAGNVLREVVNFNQPIDAIVVQ